MFLIRTSSEFLSYSFQQASFSFLGKFHKLKIIFSHKLLFCKNLKFAPKSFKKNQFEIDLKIIFVLQIDAFMRY